MALVAYGGGVLNMSGSIGAQVFSHNRFGAYIRARTTPVNPGTNRQSTLRAAVAFLANCWSQTLAPAERTAWEQYAAAINRTNKLGGQIKLTGFNHFIRSNAQSKEDGLSIVGAGPVNLTLPPEDPTIAATIDEAAQQISLVYDDTMDWAAQATGAMFVYMSKPHNIGTNFIGGPYRYAGRITGTDPGPTASPGVIAVPFIVAEDQVVKVAVRIHEEDGRLTDRFFHQSSVTA